MNLGQNNYQDNQKKQNEQVNQQPKAPVNQPVPGASKEENARVKELRNKTNRTPEENQELANLEDATRGTDI